MRSRAGTHPVRGKGASHPEQGSIRDEPLSSYREGEPVEVLVRRRGCRYDIDDQGTAVHKAGSPRGWLPVAERVVAEGSLAVYQALLELDDE